MCIKDSPLYHFAAGRGKIRSCWNSPHLLLAEELLVLLLCRLESLLEQVGVWDHALVIPFPGHSEGEQDLLSLLAKRMARVQASGSPSLTSAAAFQTQLRSLPTLALSVMSGTTRAKHQSPGTCMETLRSSLEAKTHCSG